MWYLILMLLHCVHSRSNYDKPALNTKHCIKMNAVRDREITTILAKFTDFLNKIADEHVDIDIPFIKIHIENHSDDESEEKDTKLRVMINDCHDFEDKNDAFKVNVDKELEEVASKQLKADITTVQDMPDCETLLKDIAKLTQENDKLKQPLDRCNKTVAVGREMEERKLKSNNNEEFLLSNTDSKVINEIIKSIGKSADNVEERITVTDKNVQNILKTTHDLSLNSSDLNDEPRIDRISDKVMLNNKETQAKDLANAIKIVQKVSLNETEAKVNILAKRNHWKGTFIKFIAKLLDDTVSNIEFIKDNNNKIGVDVLTEDLFNKKSNKNYVNLNSDDKKDVSMKQNYNNSGDSKDNVEISKKKVDLKEKNISKIEHTDSVITEKKYLNQPTNANNDDYKYDKDDNLKTNTKSEENVIKEKNKLVSNLEDNEFENSIYRTDTEIDKEVSNNESVELIAYPDNADKYSVNTPDSKRGPKIDYFESIDNERVILEETDALQTKTPLINIAGIISVNVDTVVNENIPHDDKHEVINLLLSNNQNKYLEEIIPVNVTFSDVDINNNSIKISYDEAILNKNKQFTEINTTENAIDTRDFNKNNEDSNEITEQKLPEVLPLSLEDNGEEFLEILEREADKSKPLFVYIQEKKGQNEYVFFSKK